ncbi:MAG TPA: SPFH domain-containing protein, partial [Elusimicrobiota bacterium]|nr:SPFH domain-containing protein [Elusimicrobiota bacterium]
MALFEVIKYEGPNETLVWKWPGEAITWGSQVIVNQTQEALFYRNGQALDVLGPGRHTLQTANIPILQSIVNIPFGEKTPFPAEIFFVDRAVLLDVKWGTQRPVPILDPVLNIFLPMRANGQFGFRVVDTRKLVVQLVGTVPTLEKEDIIEYFRGVILTKTKDYIASELITRRLSILTVTAYLADMSKQLKVNLQEDFNQFGLEIVNFFVNSIDVPEDDPQVQTVKQAMADKASYSIMGDDAYRVKRTFDVMEEAAKNEGGMNLMGTGMGFGLGMGAGSGFAGMAGGMISSALPAGQSGQRAALPAPSAMVTCPSCKAQTYSAFKFCTNCGSGLLTPNAVCPACKSEIPVGAKFCGHCALKIGVTFCPACKKEIS